MIIFDRLSFRFQRQIRIWLRDNPRALKSLRRSRCLSMDPDSVSRGLAVGLFFGLTPTVGFQTLILLPTCVAVRANFPLAFAATWVNNPLTMGPLYLVFQRLGQRYVEPNLLPASVTDSYPWLSVFTDTTVQMLVGSLFIAIPIALLGFFAARCLYAGRRLVR